MKTTLIILIVALVVFVLTTCVLATYIAGGMANVNSQDKEKQTKNIVLIPEHIRTDERVIFTGSEFIKYTEQDLEYIMIEEEWIPRKIMQTYISSSIPQGMATAMNSIIQKNPGYEYRFYDNQACEDFITEHYGKDSKEMQTYQSLIPGAYRADVFRLCWLYIVGGFYVDCSMVAPDESISFDTLVSKCGKATKTILVRECEETLQTKWSIYQAFIGAMPKSPVIRAVLDGIIVRVEARYIPETCYSFITRQLLITGPSAFGQELNVHFGRKPITPYDLGKAPFDSSLFLLEFRNGNEKTVSIGSELVFNTKYEGWREDRPPRQHYSTLFRQGRIYYSSLKPTWSNETTVEETNVLYYFTNKQYLDSTVHTALVAKEKSGTIVRVVDDFKILAKHLLAGGDLMTYDSKKVKTIVFDDDERIKFCSMLTSNDNTSINSLVAVK